MTETTTETTMPPDARTVLPGQPVTYHGGTVGTVEQRLRELEERVARLERPQPGPLVRHAYEPAGPGGAWCGRCGKAMRVGMHS